MSGLRDAVTTTFGALHHGGGGRPRRGLSWGKLGLAALLAPLCLLFVLHLPTAGADETKTPWYIPDYATALNDLTPAHQHAWRLYRLYKIYRDQARLIEGEIAATKSYFNETYGQAGGGGALITMLKDKDIAENLVALQNNLATYKAKGERVKEAWEKNKLDVAVGDLGLLDEILDVEVDDPDRPGMRKTLKMDRIEFRLLTGKTFTIFQAGAPAGGPEPVVTGQAPEAPAATSSGDCPPCPAGKQFCWCRDGKTLCYDPKAGEICLPPVDEERGAGTLTRPDTPPARSREQTINDILRGN